jgi:hypothetical protein
MIATPFSVKFVRRFDDILSPFHLFGSTRVPPYPSLALALIEMNRPIPCGRSFGNRQTKKRERERERERGREREGEGLDVSLGTSGVYARGEVSSSNKRKVALRILLLLLHTDHRLPPSPLLGYRSSSSSPRFFLFYRGFLCASFPRNRAYFSLGSCKQSDSKLPAIVAHSATMTTDPGEALNTAEVEDAPEDRLPGGEAESARCGSRESENGSVNALDRIAGLRR